MKKSLLLFFTSDINEAYKEWPKLKNLQHYINPMQMVYILPDSFASETKRMLAANLLTFYWRLLLHLWNLLRLHELTKIL